MKLSFYSSTWLVAVASASASTLSVIYHEGAGCRGAVVAHENVLDIDTLKCHVSAASSPIDSSAGVRSARIQGLDEDEKSSRHWAAQHSKMQRTVRFYSNDACFNNCTHRYVVGQKTWDDCVTFRGRFYDDSGERVDLAPIPLESLSFNIVEVGTLGSLGHSGGDKAGSVLSDGFCILSHGQRIVIHGKEYRMQQVAASWFREIPAEQWDEKVHLQSNENRFPQHGDVDPFGKTKNWQRTADWFVPVPLEDWNNTVHVVADPQRQADTRLMYALEDYCMTMLTNNLTDDGEIRRKFPSLDVANVCQEVQRWSENSRILKDEVMPEEGFAQIVL